MAVCSASAALARGVRWSSCIVAFGVRGEAVSACRVLLAGRMAAPTWTCTPSVMTRHLLVSEVKSRKDGAGFALIERWLGENDVLFLRRARAAPVVVVPWATWVRLMQRGF